jgi:hypothetical protein
MFPSLLHVNPNRYTVNGMMFAVGAEEAMTTQIRNTDTHQLHAA